MKQRITPKELNKLTDAQKERLREWWKPQAGDCFISEDGSHSVFSQPIIDKRKLVPLLSIGQMIELINEKKPLKSISKARFDKWIVNIETSTLGYKDELCDSLWETVTRIL